MKSRAGTANTNTISSEAGDFYASTGVTLRAYEADSQAIKLEIASEPQSKYTVQFIGQGGKVLQTSASETAAYNFKGDALYARAKVSESKGKAAWTQPVFRNTK